MVDKRPLVLVVEDDEGAAVLHRRRLERADFRVKIARDIDSASGILEEGGIDLVLIDYRLGNASGLDFHRRMKATGFDVPVVVVSGSLDNSTVIEAIRAGVRDVVVKTTEYLDTLPDTVRRVLSQSAVGQEWAAKERPGGCVLILEDDLGVATLQRRRLERAGYDVVLATSAEEATEIVSRGRISLAVLDLRLRGDVSGLDLYERFKANGWNIPAILVTAFGDQSVAIRALRAGIRDFVPKSADYLDYLPSAVERVATQVQTERKLVESELRFASIIGTTMDAILMCDEQLAIVLFNRSAEEMFECAAADAINRRLAQFLPDLKLEHDPARGSQPPGNLRRRAELDGVSATGKRVPIEVSVSEVMVHGKRFYTVIARDISERRRTEMQLREADRRKDEFLGMLAHELRNPLAAVMNAGEVLSRTVQDDAGQKLAGVVKRQAKALARMVDDLLDVSRVTLGKIQLAKEPLLLGPVVARAADSVREAARSNEQQLLVNVDSDPVWLLGDATRLEQVLVNLLGNALKFTPRGGHITVEARREAGHAVIRVRDTGVGIDQNLLPKVFELFVQGDTSLDRSKSGLGIGLALVTQVVLLHGGQVEVSSEGPQKGSEFAVRLPVVAQAGLSGQDETASTSARPARSLQVLVVDDQPDIADSVVSMLSVLGHRAEAVYDGESALRKSKARPPDVFLIDVGMPGMTGYELAQLVRQDPELSGISLVALTGYGREQDRTRAFASGFDLHLTKPVAAAKLQAALAALAETAT